MISSDLVQAHVNKGLELSAAFDERIAREVDVIISNVSDHILSKISQTGGVIKQSPKNARSILEIESVFLNSLSSSEYYPTVLAFVSNFVDQVDEFETFYDDMRSRLPLPEMLLTPEDIVILSNQAAVSVAVLEGHLLNVNFELRNALSRSLGGLTVKDLAKGVIETVRKVTKVGPIAKDQWYVFHRLISSLVYNNVEASGRTLKYAYAGPKSRSSRYFCNSLMNGKTYTKKEIAAMKNDQVMSVFNNCGGYGCRHFWQVMEVIQ